MSLLWALLFISISLIDSTFLYIQPRNHSEKTLLYMGQREGGKKLKARMKRRIQKQMSCYRKAQEQRKVLVFSHVCGNGSSGVFPSLLQKTAISGIRQNDWWTAAMWSLVIAVNYNQWVTVLSIMIHKCSAHLELLSDEYLIPTSPLLGGAFLPLHLSELAFKVPY